MDRPLLTITVPCYNVQDYLDRGLATYDDSRLCGLLEVVVVNDGSTDATHDIAASFVARNPRIFKLIDKPNGGHGSAINAGMKSALGKYFRVIDGDDWVNTDNLVKLLEELRTIDVDLVVDVKCEEDMRTGMRKLFPFPVYIPQDGKSHAFAEVCTRDDIASFIMIHTLMLRTDYLNSVGLHLLEKTFYVDFEYVVKGSIDAQSIQFVDVNVYQYLVGNAAQSVAEDNYVKHWDDHTRVTKEMLTFYQSRKDDLDLARLDYLRRRCELLINTHYNIALIFDKDRKRGIQRAKDFRLWLQAHHPAFAASAEGRYRKASLLHYLGVNSQDKLNRLQG